MNGIIERIPLGVQAEVYQTRVEEIVDKLIEIGQLTKEINQAFDTTDFHFSINSAELTQPEEIGNLKRMWKRRAYAGLITKMEIRKFMSQKENDELSKTFFWPEMPNSVKDAIDSLDEISEEAMHNFAMGYIKTADSFLDRQIQETWKQWRPQGTKYKTNKEQWKVSPKIIREYMICSYGNGLDHDKKWSVTSLENVFRLLDGKGFVEGSYGELASAIDTRTKSGETEYFKWKAFKNKNVHIVIKRQDLLDRFNEIGCGEGSSLPHPVDMEIVDNVLNKKPKQSNGFEYFGTPETVSNAMVELAGVLLDQDEITREDEAMEPNCGDKRLAYRLLNDFKFEKINLVDSDPKWFADVDRTSRWEFEHTCMDFLDLEPLPTIKVILMNPPFSNGQDMAHVYHASKFLKRGGILVAVMSPHWTFAQDKRSKAFRDWASDVDADWHPLPDGSFKESGTNVSTGLLTLRRPDDAVQNSCVSESTSQTVLIGHTRTVREYE